MVGLKMIKERGIIMLKINHDRDNNVVFVAEGILKSIQDFMSICKVNYKVQLWGNVL